MHKYVLFYEIKHNFYIVFIKLVEPTIFDYKKYIFWYFKVRERLDFFFGGYFFSGDVMPECNGGFYLNSFKLTNQTSPWLEKVLPDLFFGDVKLWHSGGI